jgi:pyocin large subunit-like protein
MARRIFKLLIFGALAAFLLLLWFEKQTNPTSAGGRSRPPSAQTFSNTATPKQAVPRVAGTWGNIATLPDHFARHGSDFGAASAEDYARLAWQFLQRAKAEGLPAKVDPTGTLRVYDPESGAFAAYNRDGTTKTFFKPGRPGYFDRQPGHSVNLKTWK